MRKFILTALMLILLQSISAQRTLDWGAFYQKVDAAPYVGKRFKLEAAVKVHTIDSTAEAELWVRVDKKGKKMGFFYNMMDKPIRTSEWKKYLITGTIDKDALFISFGGLYFRKGIFYYDDFKLSVETKADQWEEIALPDASFESDTVTINKTWSYLKKEGGFITAVTDSDAFKDKHSFKVDGANFKAKAVFGSDPKLGKTATVNNIPIYYEEYGEGEPLLLLHGNSESINSFRLQIPELAKHYHVYAIDTRGHGKSGDDGKLYTYDLFADDMNALLDHLHLDSVNIIGWSDGGNTGLIMAMKYPKKVKKLVTMGAVIFIDNTVVGKWVFKVLRKEKKELANDTSFYAKGRSRRVDLLLTEPRHTFEELKQIKCPVLVMAGEKDIVKEEHTKGIAANIPGATLMIVPKATHELPWDDPKVFNLAVLDFLKQ